MAEVTYRSIVKAIVSRELDRKVCKMAGDSLDNIILVSIEDIELENDRKNGWIDFECNINVHHHHDILGNDYRAHGFVDESGYVRLCGVDFERTYVTKNEDGSWDRDKRETKHFYLYGEELRAFKFDK